MRRFAASGVLCALLGILGACATSEVPSTVAAIAAQRSAEWSPVPVTAWWEPDGCRNRRGIVRTAWRQYPELRGDLAGVWTLCAMLNGDRNTVGRMLPRVPQDPVWREVRAWMRWWYTPAVTTLPATWPSWLGEPLRRILWARIQARPSAPWAVAAVRRHPRIVPWLEPDSWEPLVAAWPVTLGVELVGALRHLGRPGPAWRLLNRLRRRSGVGGPITQPARWYPAREPDAILALAELAFGARDWTAAAALGERAWQRFGKARGLLLWGRSLARQGRLRAAYTLWREHWTRIEEPTGRTAIGYRLGLLAEDLGLGDTTAAEWYARAAATEGRGWERSEAAFRYGWLAWRAGAATEAARRWRAALVRTQDPLPQRRLLYWLGVADPTDGRSWRRLLREAPLSYYAYLLQQRGYVPSVTWEVHPEPPLPVTERTRIALLAQLGLDLVAGRWALHHADLATDPQVRLLWLRIAAEHGAAPEALERFWRWEGERWHQRAPRFDLNRWRVVYPRPFATFVSAAATASGVDPALIFAVMREESRFRPGIVSPAGAVGLLQLMPATAQRTAADHGLPYTGTRDLFRPDRNLLLGAHHLAGLLASYDGALPPAIAAYNAGRAAVERWRPGRVPWDHWVEEIPYRETRRYVKKVLRSWARYRALPERAG